MFGGRIHSCSLSFIILSLSCQQILILRVYNAPPISLEIGRTFMQCFSHHYIHPTLTGGHGMKHTGKH